MKKDERRAPGDYRKLLHHVQSPRSKRIIHGIIKDEKRHLKLLKRIKR